MPSFSARSRWDLFRTLDAQELKPIRVSLSLGSAQLPLWAAHDAGFFAKHGLNAELLGLQAAARQVQLILAGDALAASLSGATPVRARIEGADTIIMMGLLNSFTLSVITVPEIKKPADLKGRLIGVGSLGGSPTLLTQRLLKKWGLEPNVKFLATGGYVESVAALEKRRVHAAVLDPPRAYIARKKFGFTELANLGQDFKYATTVIVARESQLRKERETFFAIRQGSDRGNSPCEDRSGVCDQSLGENAPINRTRDTSRKPTECFRRFTKGFPIRRRKESSRF